MLIPSKKKNSQNIPFTLSQNLDSTVSVNYEEDHQMFFCSHEGYWNATLIRIRSVNDDYDMKIYNK